MEAEADGDSQFEFGVSELDSPHYPVRIVREPVYAEWGVEILNASPTSALHPLPGNRHLHLIQGNQRFDLVLTPRHFATAQPSRARQTAGN